MWLRRRAPDTSRGSADRYCLPCVRGLRTDTRTMAMMMPRASTASPATWLPICPLLSGSTSATDVAWYGWRAPVAAGEEPPFPETAGEGLIVGNRPLGLAPEPVPDSPVSGARSLPGDVPPEPRPRPLPRPLPRLVPTPESWPDPESPEWPPEPPLWCPCPWLCFEGGGEVDFFGFGDVGGGATTLTVAIPETEPCVVA